MQNISKKILIIALVIVKFKYLIFDPLGGVKGGGVKLWHCHFYLQALGNHGLKREVVEYNSFDEMCQIKVEEVLQGNALNLHTPLTSGVGFKGQILKLCRCKYFFIKLSTKTYLWSEWYWRWTKV